MRVGFSALFSKRGMTAKRKRPNTAGAGSESAEQKTLFEFWALAAGSRFNLPEAVLFAVPNGGRRDVITAARLKAEGVRAGVPDVMLAVARGGYHGLFLELKRRSNAGSAKGRVSTSQKDVHEKLTEQGYRVVVAHGAQEAINAICDYLSAGA